MEDGGGGDQGPGLKLHHYIRYHKTYQINDMGLKIQTIRQSFIIVFNRIFVKMSQF